MLSRELRAHELQNTERDNPHSAKRSHWHSTPLSRPPPPHPLPNGPTRHSPCQGVVKGLSRACQGLVKGFSWSCPTPPPPHPLVPQVRSRNRRLVAFLLRFRVDAAEPASQACRRTALHFLQHPHLASATRDAAIAEALIRRGAPLEAQDEFGRTPLAAAACRGNWAVVPALVRAGACGDTQDTYLQTPLHYALQRRCPPRAPGADGRRGVQAVSVAMGGNHQRRRRRGVRPV